MKSVIEETAYSSDNRNALSSSLSTFGVESFKELILTGKAQIKIDPKYPSALGISTIIEQTMTFGNSSWEILLNPYSDNPFFSSDFPVAIEKTRDPRILNRIVPLSPDIAIRIYPDTSFDRKRPYNCFSKFKYIIHRINRQEAKKINTLIVRCAEGLVFFRDDHRWVRNFVEKNAKFRVEPKNYKTPHETGNYLFCTQEIAER